MIIYKCDNKNCEKESPCPLKVHLKGYVGYSGGILLPDNLREFEFCCDECFLDWIKAASSTWNPHHDPNR